MKFPGKEQRMLISPVLFVAIYAAVVVMAGVHEGILIGLRRAGTPNLLRFVCSMLFWGVVAMGLSLQIRHLIQVKYERPIRMLAEAARQVAGGDFSVYVPTMHTSDKLDYVDRMILDFDCMVEQLGSMEVMKTDFVSNVSHEIKTPLAVIHTNAELLDMGGLSMGEQKRCITEIRQSSRRLAGLIANMLRLNRLEKQLTVPERTEYDLCGQLAECALQFENIWEEKNIDFAADMADETVIYADAGLLEMVWTNLLSNAMKFTPTGGTVTLTQRTQAGHIVVSVSDSGCGMDDEAMKHIFDKFYQGDTSHATEGNGLGLALVRRILDLVGGEIAVDSKPGAGSIFTIRLPIQEPDREEEVHQVVL